MAKKNVNMSFKGLFDLDELTVQEEDKTGIHNFDLKKELQYFNGRNVSIKIEEAEPLQPKE